MRQFSKLLTTVGNESVFGNVTAKIRHSIDVRAITCRHPNLPHIFFELLDTVSVTVTVIRDKGLELVTKLAEKCLEDVIFDGNYPSNYEVLIEKTGRLAASHLLSGEWPAEDAKAVTARISMGSRQRTVKLIEDAREVFDRKIGADRNARQEDVVADIHTAQRRGSILHRGSRTNSGIAGTLPFVIDESIIGFRDANLTSTLAEVFGKLDFGEPLMRAIEILDDSTSIEAFLLQSQ